MSLPNYYTSLFTRIMPDLVQEIAVLRFKICPDCEVCSFTIHLALQSPQPANSFFAEPWIDFSFKPFIGGRKVHFL